jgi:UDP-GlcNAc:undecaprenyl-phosphate GlcNAc-1-phosphate transferase
VLFLAETPALHLAELAWPFLCALATALLLTPLLRRWAVPLGLVDKPDGHRKIHKDPIPRVGGLVVIAGLVLTTGLWVWWQLAHGAGDLPPMGRMAALLGGVAMLVMVGVLDDRFDLRGRHKLLGQIVAVTLVVLPGGLRVDQVEFMARPIPLGPLAIPFSYFLFLGAINAANLLDGMDGLLTSVGLVGSVTLAVLAYLSGQTLTLLLAVALAGALLGFLTYNRPPASVYLGDSGSMSVGLLLTMMAVNLERKGDAPLPLALPVCLLFLPILDTAAAIVRRKLTGKSIYTADRGHLHHCLARAGWKPAHVMILVAFLGLVTSTALVLAFRWQDDRVAWLTLALLGLGFVVFDLFGKSECRLIYARLKQTFTAKGSSDEENNSMLVRLQGSGPWEELWEELLAKALELNLQAITLDVNMPVAHEAFHARWKRLGGKLDTDKCWKTELPVVLRGMVVGRVSLQGDPQDETVWRILAQLQPLLARFEQLIQAQQPVKGPVHQLA